MVICDKCGEEMTVEELGSKKHILKHKEKKKCPLGCKQMLCSKEYGVNHWMHSCPKAKI